LADHNCGLWFNSTNDKIIFITSIGLKLQEEREKGKWDVRYSIEVGYIALYKPSVVLLGSDSNRVV
jgi:hypothetical protein